MAIKSEIDHRSVVHIKDSHRVSLETNTLAGVSITELLRAFEDVMRGHGYYFEGNLEIVNDEEA